MNLLLGASYGWCVHSMKQESLESATSYGVGGLGISMGALIDVSQGAQAIAMILGCFVVAIRLVHDAMNLYRVWKNK